MQNAITTLRAMDFDTTSVTRAVQQVREKVNASPNPIGEAQYIVNDITGINVDFTDEAVALHVAQYVVYDALKLEEYNFQDSIDNAFVRTAKLLEDQPWAKTTIPVNAPQHEVAVIAGIDTKVAVKANGKIKKGGAQVLAAALYKLHVLDNPTPMTNKEFVAVLMKDVGMTLAGARTYAYNCRKNAAK